MRFASQIRSTLAGLALAMAAIVTGQQKINPHTQIQWPTCPAGQAYIPFSNTCAAIGTAANPAGTDGQLQVNRGGIFGASPATVTPAGDIATPTQVNVGTTILHKDGVSPANLIAMGADPTGTNDSTAAINSWLSYAASHGVEAYCPPGIYLTSGSTLTGSHDNLHIRGPHWAYPVTQPGCHFKLTATNGSIFSDNVVINSVEIENVWFDLNSKGTAHALNTGWLRWWKVHGNYFSGASSGAGATYWQSGGDLNTWAHHNIFLGAAMYSLDWQGAYSPSHGADRGCNGCWVYQNIDQVGGGVRIGGDVHYTYNDKESGFSQINPALSYAALIDCSDSSFPLACDVTGNYIEMAGSGAYPLSSLTNNGTTTTIVTSTPPTALSVGSLVSIENTHTAADGLNLRVASKSGSTITVAQTIGAIASIPSYAVSALTCTTGTCTVTTSATNPAVAGDAFYLSGTGTCADFVFDRWAITILSTTQFTFQATGCTASASTGSIILGQIVGPYAGGIIGVNVDSNNYSANIVGNRLWAGTLNKGDPNVAIKLANVMGWSATGNLYEFWTTDKSVTFSALGAGSFLNAGESRGPGGTQGDGSTNFWEPPTTNSGNNVSQFGGTAGISCSGLGCIVSNHRLNFTASTYTGTTLDLSTGNVFRWTSAATISTIKNAKPGQIFSIEATATPVVLPTATFNNASGADATLALNRPVWYQVGYAGNIREIGYGSVLASAPADATKFLNGTLGWTVPGGGGGTGVVATVAPTTYSGTTTLGPTTFYTPGTAGQFRICYSLYVTVAGTAGTFAPLVAYTGDGHAFTNGGFASVLANTQWSSNVASAGAVSCSSFYADASQPIKYELFASGVTGTPTVRYSVALERLQ